MPSDLKFFPKLLSFVDQIKDDPIPAERKNVLAPLLDYGQQKLKKDQPLLLNFICTHNSRRSQFAQVWASFAAAYYGMAAQCFSGGTETTAFNETAIAVLESVGFQVEGGKGGNPKYELRYSMEGGKLTAYSKLYDAPENPKKDFAAVMTCAHADENCPFIPGAEARFALDYADPKEFDGTDQALAKYQERSRQIAREMFYLFEKLNQS